MADTCLLRAGCKTVGLGLLAGAAVVLLAFLAEETLIKDLRGKI